MNPTPTFDRAYGEIRRRVLSGAWLPGQRIDLPHLADALGASTTPVRDALNRMVGERLLSTGIGDGFAMPAMTEPDLHDLYDWHHQLVVLATRGRKPGRLAAGRGRDGDSEDDATFAALFATIAARSDNLEMRAAIAGAEARLAPVRLAEQRLFATADRPFRERFEKQVAKLAPIHLRTSGGDAAGLVEKDAAIFADHSLGVFAGAGERHERIKQVSVLQRGLAVSLVDVEQISLRPCSGRRLGFIDRRGDAIHTQDSSQKRTTQPSTDDCDLVRHSNAPSRAPASTDAGDRHRSDNNIGRLISETLAEPCWHG